MTPEHRIQNEIRLWCGEHDYLCFRCNVGKVKCEDGTWFDTGLPTGFSDLIILPGNGIIYFCEVKGPGGKQRPDQVIFQKAMEAKGYKYILAYKVKDVEEVIENA